MNKNLEDIFYDRIPGKQRIRLNFRMDPVTLDQTTRTGTVRLVLDDPRWFEKKIDGEIYYIDSIDGNRMSASSIVESFDRGNKFVHGGKGVPIFINDFMSENKGAKTIEGLKKLISAQKLEEAFLSCNSIFLRRLRVLLFCYEKKGLSFDEWNNEKFRGAGSIINALRKSEILSKELSDSLITYCRDRNRIDHEMSEGSIESRDIMGNLVAGLSYLDTLEEIFIKYIDSLA